MSILNANSKAWERLDFQIADVYFLDGNLVSGQRVELSGLRLYRTPPALGTTTQLLFTPYRDSDEMDNTEMDDEGNPNASEILHLLATLPPEDDLRGSYDQLGIEPYLVVRVHVLKLNQTICRHQKYCWNRQHVVPLPGSVLHIDVVLLEFCQRLIVQLVCDPKASRRDHVAV